MSFIKLIVGLWNNRPKKPQKTFVEFVVNPDKSVSFNFSWKNGDEELFAGLLYNLNGGNLFEEILNYMHKLALQHKDSTSYQKMIGALKQMYIAENRLLKELDKTMKDTPIVKPSEVFGKSKKHSVEDEDDEPF